MQSVVLTVMAFLAFVAAGCKFPVPPDVDEDGRSVDYFQITAFVNGAGIVTGPVGVDDGISCGANCAESYATGASVTLTAVPAAGHRFSGWMGDCPDGVCEITANRMVTAVFVPEYVLTVTHVGDGEGRVTAIVGDAAAGIDCGADCSESFGAGTVVQLRTAPGVGSSFVGWSGGCTGVDCTVTVLAETRVTAEFRRNQCTPNTRICSNDATVVCDAQGQATFVDCRDLGCWNGDTNMPAATGDRCADLSPSNGLATFLDMTPSGPVLDLGEGSSINTDTGIVVSNGQALTPPSFTVTQSGVSVEIRVFVVRSLVMRGTMVNGGRALAFVADGPIQVLGLVNAAARPFDRYGPVAGGPGATRDPTRCSAVKGTSMPHDMEPGVAIGGGGGGYGSVGGAGGGASSGSGTRGAAIETDLQPLVGGCGGAPGAAYPTGEVINYAFGGPGGGAIQLVSRTSISVGVAGTSIGKIHVGGGAGGANDDGEAYRVGGGGGGSGGAVLLEAPLVIVSGSGAIIAANGGGGGSGLCGEAKDATASPMFAAGGPFCSEPLSTNYVGGGSGGASGFGGDGGDGRAVVGAALGANGGGGGGSGYLVVRNNFAQFAPQDGGAISATIKQLPLRKRARP